jgi:DNA-binding HxlR family transcriptional regulator
MAKRRTYGDRCGIARALDVVGERWALLVVRELLLGPKRFTDLRTGLPHVSPDVLAQRLRELEQDGVVRRRTLAPPAGSKVYELTDRGRGLEPVILALGRWGTSEPFPPGDARLGPDSAVIALLTVFNPAAADGLAATYELRFDDQVFRARVADGRIEFARGTAQDPDATIETNPATLAEVLWRGRRLADAERADDMAIEGNRRAVTRFLRLFRVPNSA